jgi:hypothetical protein
VVAGFAGSCSFAFAVPGVPRQKFYGVEVGHRKAVTFSAAQWASGQVVLTLGT